MYMRSMITIALLFGSMACGLPRAEEDTQELRADQIKVQKLIRSLGSPQFKEREAAEKMLSGMSADILPVLREALKSTGDPEVHNRLTRVIESLAFVHVALACPLTGESAVFGKLIKQGVNLAVKEVNESGILKGRKFKIHFFDDAGHPKEAATVALAIAGDRRIWL